MRTTIREVEGGETAGAGHLERARARVETEPHGVGRRESSAAGTAAALVARRHSLARDSPRSVGHSEALFYMIAAASLMESATDLYTENLIEYFAGDDEITSWLKDNWLPEELQHGRALRRYVETAWPDFPWDEVRQDFIEEFRPFCDEALEQARGLEMASRCVVETGTASFYTCLSRASPDPVLASVDPADRRGRGPPLQAFLSVLSQISRHRTPAPDRGGARVVAASAHDRRRRPARRAKARSRRASPGGAVRYAQLSPNASSVPRADAPAFSGGDDSPHAAQTARSRSASPAGNGPGACRRNPAHRPLTGDELPRWRETNAIS